MHRTLYQPRDGGLLRPAAYRPYPPVRMEFSAEAHGGSWWACHAGVMRQLMKTGLLGLALLGLGTGMADAATAYTNTGANLRRSPTTDAPVLRVVPGGTLLTVACVGQWCRTSY